MLKKKTKSLEYRNQINTQESKIASATEENSQLTKQVSD
jgi:cell division protein FtsL